MLVRVVIVIGACAVALAACSNDDVAGDIDAPAEIYAVQTDDGWHLQEAVDPAADDPLTANERPALDWWAEYVRAKYTEMVRLSGHVADLEETQAELEQLGFTFDRVTVPGHEEALAGTDPRDESSPEMLLVKSGDRTLMALSYEVERGDLADFMQSVEVTGRDDWVAAGGVVR